MPPRAALLEDTAPLAVIEVGVGRGWRAGRVLLTGEPPFVVVGELLVGDRGRGLLPHDSAMRILCVLRGLHYLWQRS